MLNHHDITLRRMFQANSMCPCKCIIDGEDSEGLCIDLRSDLLSPDPTICPLILDSEPTPFLTITFHPHF